MRFAPSFRGAAPLVLPLLASAACATAEPLPPQGNEGNGGDTATGGGGGNDSGGMATSGGATGTTGGTASKGGATSTTGGTTSKGGATGSGGTTSKGGATSTTGGSDTALPYFDDFETPIGDRWIVADTKGTWSVKAQDGSQAYVAVATDATLSVGGSIEWTNMRVETRAKFVAVGTSPVIYLMARWADGENYFVLEFRPGDSADPEGDMKLRQKGAGATDDLCRYKPPSVLPGQWYTIGFTVSGGMDSVATLLLNGMPVTPDHPCKLTKPIPTAGGIALGADDATAAFDDVSVKAP